jgi:hypothetical protein
MEFEENSVEIEGNSTRNLKEKHKEFFTRGLIKFFITYFHIFFTFIAQNTLNRIIVKNITY